MSRKLLALCFLSLAAVSCGDDRHDHEDECATIGCETGVAIQLGHPASKYASSLPLSIHICFDASCDDVVLENGREGLACGGTPGVGAPDQLTSCFVNQDGSLEIDIARTDGRDYSDGAKHTIAVSMRDQTGKIIHEEASSVVLASVNAGGPSCGATCYQSTVSLDQ